MCRGCTGGAQVRALVQHEGLTAAGESVRARIRVGVRARVRVRVAIRVRVGVWARVTSFNFRGVQLLVSGADDDYPMTIR